MPSNPDNQGRPPVYEICVEGRLGDDWAEWFGGLEVATDKQGNTVLTGPIPDQAALYGLLAKLRDLGLPLVSLERTGSGLKPADALHDL
jgi:hypothetical protein